MAETGRADLWDFTRDPSWCGAYQVGANDAWRGRHRSPHGYDCGSLARRPGSLFITGYPCNPVTEVQDGIRTSTTRRVVTTSLRQTAMRHRPGYRLSTQPRTINLSAGI
jgi:hypothetical protein